MTGLLILCSWNLFSASKHYKDSFFLIFVQHKYYSIKLYLISVFTTQQSYRALHFIIINTWNRKRDRTSLMIYWLNMKKHLVNVLFVPIAGGCFRLREVLTIDDSREWQMTFVQSEFLVSGDMNLWRLLYPNNDHTPNIYRWKINMN